MSSDELGPTLEYLQSAQRKLLAEVKDFDLNYYLLNGGWSPGQTAPHLIRTEKTMYLMFWISLRTGLSQSNYTFKRTLQTAARRLRRC